jgi:lipocalin-like protein
MNEPRPIETIEELYGTWKLVSWTRRLVDSGETVEAFGKQPRGLLHYGRDGHVSWVMTKENRAMPRALTELNDAERAELYDTMVAYAGTFTFDGNAATHRVQISWNEVWTGTAQVRNLRFEGRRLIMTTNPQSGIDGRLSSSVFVWQRPA